VLRREIGLKIVEVESDKANVEGGDVLWTGKLPYFRFREAFSNLIVDYIRFQFVY